MGKKINVLILVLVFSIATIATGSFAFAQQEIETTAEPLQTTAEQETPKKDKSAGREARINAYKEKVEQKLSEFQSKRLASLCKPAQGRITSLRARVSSSIEGRKTTYQAISTRLDVLIEKLEKAQIDTTDLEALSAELKNKVNQINEALDAYDTVLADLEALDCASDPETFKSALETAREMQVEIRDMVVEFRSFAKVEIKKALEEVKSQLKTKKEEDL